ncbi:MAG: hypothetical protein ABEJ71_00575 [Halodesulfurarchaeum sp.]
MELSTVLLVATQIATFLLAGFITYQTYLAYWRSGSVAIRTMMVGFGTIATGILLSLVLFLSGVLEWIPSSLLEGTFLAVGLALLTYSLYVTDNRLRIRTVVTEPSPPDGTGDGE